MTYLTDDEVREKFKQQDYEPIIMNYLPLARYIAARTYSRNYTHDPGDIYGEAYLALVEGVRRINGHKSPFKFMFKTIRGALLNYVLRSHTIKRPDGKERLEPWLYTEEGDETFFQIPELLTDFNMQLEKELIKHPFITPVERILLRLTLDGYTREEIATICRYSPAMVQRSIENMRTKVRSILYGVY